MEVPVKKMPYQVFDFLRDGLTWNLNRNIEFNHRPSNDYLKLIEESIQFIEENTEFTTTKRIRELVDQAKAFDDPISE